MKCSNCGWQGHLATISHMEREWTYTSPPLCLLCRQEYRKQLRRRGIFTSKVTPCRV